MRKFAGLLFILAFSLGVFNSCGTKPMPCYTTSVPIDSIHAGQEVVFDAGCTQSGREFFWEFNSAHDSSTSAQQVVTHTFDSAGTASVFLYVINGGKSASKTDVFIVLP